MLKEAIEKIQALANRAHKPTVLHWPGDPPHINRLIHGDGTIERIEADPPTRTLKLKSIADLTALATDHFDPEIRKAPERQIVTFDTDSSYNGVVRLWFDSKVMRETAYVMLEPTEEYSYFIQRKCTPLVEVPDLRDAMRFTIRRSFDNIRLIEQISKLDFENTDKGSVEAARGRASMSAAVHKQVQEPMNLPDEDQIFNVRRYANHDLDVRHRLDCVLEADPHTRRWRFQPTEDGLIAFEHAVHRHVRQVVQEGIGEAPIKLYHGEAFTESGPFKVDIRV